MEQRNKNGFLNADSWGFSNEQSLAYNDRKNLMTHELAKRQINQPQMSQEQPDMSRSQLRKSMPRLQYQNNYSSQVYSTVQDEEDDECKQPDVNNTVSHPLQSQRTMPVNTNQSSNPIRRVGAGNSRNIAYPASKPLQLQRGISQHTYVTSQPYKQKSMPTVQNQQFSPDIRKKGKEILIKKQNDNKSINNSIVSQEKKVLQFVNIFTTPSSADVKMATKQQESPVKSQQNEIASKPAKSSIEDFELLEVIGHGGFGFVKLAKKLETGEFFAIKIMKKETLLKETQIDHVKQEKKLLESITKQNMQFSSKLYDTFQSNEYLYFVLEYIQGGELLGMIKRQQKPISHEEIMFYIGEIICALEELHDRNIVFRDLKPENVLIDKEGHIKLIDFGLSKQLKTKSERTFTNCGTPVYLSPEVISSQGHSFGTDIWSLGVLICEMIQGITPFHDNNQNEIYSNILACNPVYRDCLDPMWRDLCNQIFVIDQNRRATLQDIKYHKAFRDINWAKHKSKMAQPPFIPQLDDVEDLKYFRYQRSRRPWSWRSKKKVECFGRLQDAETE